MANIYCTICGEWLACDEDDCEAFDGEGVEDKYVIEAGFAHAACIDAGAVLRRWLRFAPHRDIEDEPLALPTEDLVLWLREGGDLSEGHALALLDEIRRLQVERDEARAEG